MAIKDLAVAYNGSANAGAAIELAAQMCGKYGATLTGLYASNPLRFEGNIERWVGADVMASLKAAEAQGTKIIEESFRAKIASTGLVGPAEWQSEEGPSNGVLARLARYFDILLMGQFSAPSDSSRTVRAEDLVLRTGKPIIIVPNTYEIRPFNEYAVVGWDGSRSAARALSDAMQILETKKRLDVVSVRSSREDSAPSRSSDIIRHLQRHGVDARPIVLTATREGIGQTILAYCSENQPDVLVMGAYGHSKLREDLFGGVTRHVLEHMTVPVLMSH